MRRIWAVGFLTLVLVGLQAAAPASACGCGGLATQPDAEISVSGERAVVSWDGETEQIDLMLDLVSKTDAAAIVIPTPTPATVTAGDSALFETLEETIRPRPVYADDWWGFGTGRDGAPALPSVTVLDRVEIGPLEAVTLAATNSRGLSTWLNSNGFALSPATSKVLNRYIKEKWSFVAVRIANDVPLSGSVDPIRLTFDTTRFVYPMRLSQGAETPQALRLYILDKERVDVTKAAEGAAAGPLNAGRKTVWAGDVTDPALTDRGTYLTVVDLRYEVPAIQVTTDIAIVPAGTAENVIPTREVVRLVSVLGVPLGSLIVGWAVIGLLILLGALVARTRTR
ncbi:DUF2330 domain-containing protein [Glaciihabitans arcticus]|uniref:DUF2330 domain-containing protein n=1 Tax=Glaciihabitans arcticus TaxID=2668039 RepID=A0A4Q9GVY1_9MICO|nr:DUF2330 domain-containing protein [Glaciihabitans arcticus]TBN56350.1 DUF2330 domain-containing protein [Glaciihabitans arcticus]